MFEMSDCPISMSVIFAVSRAHCILARATQNIVELCAYNRFGWP